ncbi:MAG: hypothetical protein KDC12_08520 [Flavobacteriales bacterium]|nr:hypothetical protein [Flavobacteriales bacterium]
MKKIVAWTLALAWIAVPMILSAQPFPEDNPPPCDGPFGGPCPIDGGLGFLIAAGVAYGGKKAWDLTKKG